MSGVSAVFILVLHVCMPRIFSSMKGPDETTITIYQKKKQQLPHKETVHFSIQRLTM